MMATELIRDFVNTRDILDDGEELGSSRGARRMARGEEADAGRGGWDSGRSTAGDRASRGAPAVAAREHGRRGRARGGVDVVDRVARRARIELCFEECAGGLSPAATGVDAALGRLVIAVHGAMADGSWLRLKACRASDCEWAFIDHARNHSRAWCSMKSCGNREKARVFRERHRV